MGQPEEDMLQGTSENQSADDESLQTATATDALQNENESGVSSPTANSPVSEICAATKRFNQKPTQLGKTVYLRLDVCGNVGTLTSTEFQTALSNKKVDAVVTYQHRNFYQTAKFFVDCKRKLGITDASFPVKQDLHDLGIIFNQVPRLDPNFVTRVQESLPVSVSLDEFITLLSGIEDEPTLEECITLGKFFGLLLKIQSMKTIATSDNSRMQSDITKPSKSPKK